MMNVIDTTKKSRRKNGMVSLRPLKKKILLSALLVIIASLSIITYICTTRSRPGYGGEQLISSSPSRYVWSKSSEISNQRRLAEGDQQLSDVCLDSAESEQETEEDEKRAKKDVKLYSNRLKILTFLHKDDVTQLLETLTSRVQSHMSVGENEELRKRLLKQIKRLITSENRKLQHLDALLNASKIVVRIQVNKGKNSFHAKRMLEEYKSSKKQQEDKVQKLEELGRKEKEESQDSQQMLEEWKNLLNSENEEEVEERLSLKEWKSIRISIDKAVNGMQPQGYWDYRGRRKTTPGKIDFEAAAKREISKWPVEFDKTVLNAISGRIESFPEQKDWGSLSEDEKRKWKSKMRDEITRMSYKELKLIAGHVVRVYERNDERAACDFLLRIQNRDEIAKIESLLNNRIGIRTSRRTPYELNAAQIEGGNIADENIKGELNRHLYKKAKEAISFFRKEYPEFVNSPKVMIEIEKIKQITGLDILEASEDAEELGGAGTKLSELEMDHTTVEGEGASKQKKRQVGYKKTGTQKGEYGRAILYISSEEDENE